MMVTIVSATRVIKSSLFGTYNDSALKDVNRTYLLSCCSFIQRQSPQNTETQTDYIQARSHFMEDDEPAALSAICSSGSLPHSGDDTCLWLCQ